MVIVEGANRVHIAGPAHLVEEGREVAWAEPHVVQNSLYAWILGKYVETDRANDNGHIFDLGELKAAKTSVLHAPMNMLHVPHKIMGVFVANEIVYPTGEAGADGGGDKPYLEALAAFWKYYFEDEFELVRMAHNEGSLAWSMECIPESVSCAGGCDETFAYAGRTSDTYCDHLQKPAAAKRLNKPHFSAGALVVPPALPAWKGAKVSELSTFVRTELEELEAATHDQVAEEFPHLSAPQWEKLMGQLLQAAGNPFAKGKPAGKDKPKGPHAYAPIFPGKTNVPCKVCKKGQGDPTHKKAKDIDLDAASARGRQLAREI